MQENKTIEIISQKDKKTTNNVFTKEKDMEIRAYDFYTKLENKHQKEIPSEYELLFSYNPYKKEYITNDTKTSILDLYGIPNKVSDQKLIKYIASVLTEKKLKENSTTQIRNKYLIYKDTESIDIQWLTPIAIKKINKLINKAIHNYCETYSIQTPIGFLDKLPTDPKTQEVRLANQKEVILFIKKGFFSKHDKECRQFACSILKNILIEENYEQYEEDIEHSISLFYAFIHEKFVRRFDMWPKTKNPIHDISDIHYFDDKQFMISKEKLKEAGIIYHEDIHFEIRIRPKTEESIKKKIAGNYDKSSAHELDDTWAIRFICENKDEENILSLYVLQKYNANNYKHKQAITKWYPIDTKTLHAHNKELSASQIQEIAYETKLSIKDKWELRTKEIKTKDTHNIQHIKLDEEKLQIHGCNDPVIITQLNNRIDHYNHEKTKNTAQKAQEESEAKRNVLKRIIKESGTKKYQQTQKTWETNNQQIILEAMYACIKWNKIKEHKRSYKPTSPKWIHSADIKKEQWDPLVHFHIIDDVWWQHMFSIPNKELDELAKHRKAERKEYKEKKVNEIKEVHGIWWRNKSWKWSDLKIVWEIQLSLTESFSCETQFTRRKILENIDPFSSDPVYQTAKDIFNICRISGCITSDMIKHLIKYNLLPVLQENEENKKIYEKLENTEEQKGKNVEDKIYNYYTSKLTYNEKYDMYVDPEHKQRLDKVGLRYNN